MARVWVLGVGSFAHAMAQICREDGAEVHTYLTRNYGHYGASLCGEVYEARRHPQLLTLFDKHPPDLVIPMSIDWQTQSWGPDLVEQGVPILSPVGKATQLEVDRDFAMRLCEQYGIPIPRSHYARNRLEAEEILRNDPRPYVLKNPICSPFSPVHTIVCETVEDTWGWIRCVDYAEGLFLQEYLGNVEAGHFVFVSNGEIISQISNQEYKRAFTGNMGPVAGAPLGGIVEQDPEDRYGLAKDLIHPLQPWLNKVNFHGPLQVTAMRQQDRWVPIEYNVRMGVTSGALWLRMLKNPGKTLCSVADNCAVKTKWRDSIQAGGTLTLAGYGYPYIVEDVPPLPVRIEGEIDCDLWWNEVRSDSLVIYTESHKGLDKGHRIADVNSLGKTVEDALQNAYQNISKLHCLHSYFRTDIGQNLWPIGVGF